ncbi:PaaI family thioesterase [Deinococcus sp.]|uniref:PaaI family thioesterase n=1 Tax=Deinococcus sp. TaxID=47478 RepID=UPI0025BBCE28|nr:PaaI family thioesterase [Deinococcus sp.]
MSQPTSPAEMLAYANSVIAIQTFSTLVGAQFTSISATEAVLHVPLRDDLRQHHGFAHGGLIATMADIGLTFMGAMALGPNVLTSEYKINFLRPGTGDELVARSSVISSSRRQAVTRCDIFAVAGGQEKLVATALGTIVKSEAEPVKGAEMLRSGTF